MQGNIINLFANSSSYGFRYHSYKRNEKYRLLRDQFSPLIFPAVKTDQESLVQDLVISLIRKTAEEMQHLSEEEGSFLRKFEKLLRILYRFNCCNPELIVQYQDISLQETSDEENPVLSEFQKLAFLAKDLLKSQVESDASTEEENTMDQLIFFMFGEIIKLYQADLVTCCRNLVEENRPSPFPSEEEMIKRYYKPIAEQLKGLIAS